MKRLARYLVKAPELEVRCGSEGGECGTEVEVYVHSDWAGCRSTRKSTSGVVLAVNGGMVESNSSTQGTVSLRSGEAELYAGVKGAAEGVGVKSLLMDLGIYT